MVSVAGVGDLGASAVAFARERRRPPLRPRRRGFDSSASSSPSPGVGARGLRAARSTRRLGRGGARSAALAASARRARRGAARGGRPRARAAAGAAPARLRSPVAPGDGRARRPPRRSASVDEHGARRRAARLVDAHEPLLADEAARRRDRDDVAVDLRDRVVDVVHVRLDDVDVDLLALAERARPGSATSSRAPSIVDREVVERQALGALEVEVLARSRPRARAACARRRR